MRRLLVRRWFLMALLAVLAVGFLWHDSLAAAPEAAPRSWIVASVLFLMSLPLELGVIWQALRRPGPVLLGVAITYGVLPPTAWLLSPLLPGELALGLLVIAVIPSTLASAAVWTRRAGGNDAVPVLITLVTTLTCFFVTPAWLELLARQQIDIDFGPLAGRLIGVAVVPLTIGQLLRAWRPLAVWATANKVPLGVITQLGILSMVFLGAVQSGEQLAGNGQFATPAIWALMIAIVTGLHVSMLVLGHVLAHVFGMSRADRIGVGFGGSQKTLMVGLDIGLEFFGGLAILPMVVFHVSQLLIDTLIADRLRKNAPTQPEPEPEPLEVAG